MTTSFKYVFEQDLKVSNKISCFSGIEAVESNVSGLAIKSLNSYVATEAHLECIKAAIELCEEFFPKFEFWLLVGDSTPVVDNRITRYRGLWKRVPIDVGNPEKVKVDSLKQALHESSSGLRMFGAIQFKLSAVEDAMQLWEENFFFCMVGFDETKELLIQDIVNLGWELPRGAYLAPRVLNSVISAGGVYFQPLGAFDDFESGIVIMGNPVTLSRIAGNIELDL